MDKSFQIFDFHCHPYSVPEENICVYKDALRTPEDFIAGMDRAGIGPFAGSVIPSGPIKPESFAPLHELNMRALKLAAKWEGRYIPGIHVHPAFARESCEELERMSALGVRLIGELVPYRMGWNSYSSPEAVEIFRLAGELGMVVSCHTTTLDDLDAALAAAPETVFVNAHPGEYGEYVKRLELMKKHDNMYLDISGTGLFRYGMLGHGVKTVGRERILFGTDFPVCNAAMQVGGALSEALSSADYDALFRGNAVRLLGLED